MRTSAALSTTAAKVFASVVLVGGAASVAGLGTFGSFTSTTTASQEVAAGKVVLTLGTPVLGTSVAAAGLVPGDTVQRAITLTRSSDTEKFGSVTMSTTGSANPANLLTTDATNGLQMAVDQCSVAWTKDAASDTLTCAGGTVTTVLAKRAVITSGLALPAATTDALNGTNGAANLRVTLTLPTSADDLFQGLSNSIGFSFKATQRDAEAR
jgi:predicted ribosomally synthesized peptide with SipW-like signal peptide